MIELVFGFLTVLGLIGIAAAILFLWASRGGNERGDR